MTKVTTKQVRKMIRDLGIVVQSSGMTQSQARNGEHLRNMIFYLPPGTVVQAAQTFKAALGNVPGVKVGISDHDSVGYLRVTGVHIA
jgi:hypothetical protein